MKSSLSNSVFNQHKTPLIDLRSGIAMVAIIAIGAATAAEIHLIGRLFYSEVILLAILPYLLVRERPHPGTERFHKWVLIFGGLWLWAQITTDFLMQTPYEDWTRGISKIVFLLLNYVAMRRLLNTEQRILLFGTGLVIGTAISVNAQGYEPETAWKFGLGGMYASLIGIACSLKPLRKFALLPTALLVALAFYSAYQGTRNLAGTAMIAAGVLALSRVLTAFNAQSPRGRIFGIVGVVGVGMLAYSGMGYLSNQGVFGEKIQQKYREQVKRGGGSYLLGGRFESRISLIAIQDSPILGHGSWARNREYRARYEAMLAEADGRSPTITGNDLIPSHSFFFSGWVEAGIFGAIWWGFVLWVVASSIFRLLNWSYPLGPLATFTACQLLWDIPFSPFGADRRLGIAFALVLLPVAASQATSLRLKKNAGGEEVLVAE